MLRSLARWLALAAAPTFSLMAVATAFQQGRGGTLICGAGDAPAGGMVTMYLLMSVFHLGPWLRRSPDRRFSSQ